jgi:hypothetical protein
VFFATEGFKELHVGPDLAQAARSFVISKINAQLYLYAHPEIAPVFLKPSAKRDVRQPPRLCVSPRGLWGAMMIQFAQAVTGEREHRRCPECGKWFVLGLGEKKARADRIDRVTCSGACRTRLHRRRKKARRLHASGQTAERIAEAVDSDVATVRQWTEGKENKGDKKGG